MEDVGGGQRVVEGPVVGSGRRTEKAGQRGEFVIAGLVGGDQMAGQDHRVDDAESRPRMSGLRGGSLEKADVEAGVVRHQNRPSGELEEGRQHRVDARSSGHQRV